MRSWPREEREPTLDVASLEAYQQMQDNGSQIDQGPTEVTFSGEVDP